MKWSVGKRIITSAAVRRCNFSYRRKKPEYSIQRMLENGRFYNRIPKAAEQGLQLCIYYTYICITAWWGVSELCLGTCRHGELCRDPQHHRGALTLLRSLSLSINTIIMCKLVKHMIAVWLIESGGEWGYLELA